MSFFWWKTALLYHVRLITHENTDAEVPNIRRTYEKLAFGLFVALPFGIGSLGLVAEKVVEREPHTENLQTVAFLEAVPNSESPTLYAKGGGNITIVGKVALLAESGPSGTIADVEAKPKSDQISVYVVREGDTLSQIADMFDVSANTIRWANDLRGAITPGETLVILPISGIQYTIKKDDTIGSIAKKYDGDADEIRLYNGLDDEGLVVGEQIVIPNGEIEAPKATPASSSGPRLTRGGGPTYAGYYRRPIDGGVISQRLHGYNAIDFATYAGAPIYAAASGQVIVSKGSGWNGGYGAYVVIKHGNGTQTLYAHNSGNAVAVGQWVEQGSVIGYVGSTGRSTGNHVHFEVRGATNPF